MFPLGHRRLGILETQELRQNLFESAYGNALTAVDQAHDPNSLIVVDLSNDATERVALTHLSSQRKPHFEISVDEGTGGGGDGGISRRDWYRP